MEKKISFSEELLSGFIDGELSEEDSLKVAQFASASADIKQDLIELAQVGEIVSNNLGAKEVRLDLWKSIEAKLEPKVPTSMQQTRLIIKAPSAGFWNSIFQPRFASALALGLFAVGMISSKWVELPSNNIVAQKKERVYDKSSNITGSDIALNKREEILVPLLPRRAGTIKEGTIGAQTFVSNGGGHSSNSFGYSPQFISPQQLGTEHPARGSGVRADGMQIEWMRNSKKVRIIRPKNTALPPMIWLGELR